MAVAALPFVATFIRVVAGERGSDLGMVITERPGCYRCHVSRPVRGLAARRESRRSAREKVDEFVR